MFKINYPYLYEEKGVALIIAMLVLVMLTLIGLAALGTSTTEMSISANVKGNSQALYLAEAGVNQVLYWFNNPDTFTPGTAATINGNTQSNGNAIILGDTTTYDNFFRKRRNSGTSFMGTSQSQFYDVSNTGSMTTNAANITTTAKNVTTSAMRINDATYLNNLFGYLSDTGRITEIIVYGPILQGANGNFATVRVKAETNSGATRTIEQEIGPSFYMTLQGSVESGAGASWNGNTIAHWGSIHVKNNVNRNNLNNIPTTASDPYFNLQAEGTVTIGSDTCTSSTQGSSCSNWSGYDLRAGQTVTIDTWDKAKVKAFAQGEGSYYVYDCTSGRVFKNAVGAVGSSNDFGDFKTFANGNSFELVYIDKGSSCGAGGAITVSGGGGFYTEGVFYMDIGFNTGGLGTGTSSATLNSDSNAGNDVKNHGASVNNINVNFNGVLYTTGTLAGAGNMVVYGSVVALGGYSSGGTIDIYYNSDLATNPPFNIPVVSKMTWREIR